MNISQIVTRVANFTETSGFVAFMAHGWFAFGALMILASWGIPLYWTAPIAFALAAAKEFYFDVHFEQNPPQTYLDGAKDFAGYVSGILLALAILLL